MRKKLGTLFYVWSSYHQQSYDCEKYQEEGQWIMKVGRVQAKNVSI